MARQEDLFGGPVIDDEVVVRERAFWRQAKGFLMRSGYTLERAGTMLGKWRRDYPKQAVINALDRCLDVDASDPVSFIEACLRQSGRMAPPNETDLERIKREALAKVGESRNAIDRGTA